MCPVEARGVPVHEGQVVVDCTSATALERSVLESNQQCTRPLTVLVSYSLCRDP